MILALDRMKAVEISNAEKFQKAKDFKPQDFFNDVIGVTKSLNQPTAKVVLQFDASNAPYVLTKPLHHSQEILKKENGGAIISIQVVLNFELERVILGFGDSVKVLSPRILQNRIKTKLEKAKANY